jgi:ferredoxin-NADP reductase
VRWLPGHRRAPDSWLGAADDPAADAVDDSADDLTLLRRWVPDIAERDVYVCGPETWTAAVRATLAAAGVPAGRVHVETFGW